MKKKSRLLKEYERWFQINKEMLEESEYEEGVKALAVYNSVNQLVGMLMFLMGVGEITKDEYEEMREKINQEFNTRKLYGFEYHVAVEVFNVAD